jgi:hypothetical protein
MTTERITYLKLRDAARQTRTEFAAATGIARERVAAIDDGAELSPAESAAVRACTERLFSTAGAPK